MPDGVHRLALEPLGRLVDPDEPSLLVLELQDGRYVEKARVTGDEAVELSALFAVRVTPSALLA